MSHMDKSTLEKDWPKVQSLASLKSDCHHANQGTILDNDCANWQFGRRFKNVNSQFKKRKHHFNQLKSIKTTAELPQPVHHRAAAQKVNSCTRTGNNSSSSVSALIIRLTIVLGLTPLGVSMDLRTNAIIKSCQQIFISCWKQALQIKHHNSFQSACQITGLIKPLHCEH